MLLNAAILLVGLCANALASVCIKLAMVAQPAGHVVPLSERLMQLAHTPVLWGGVVLYGMALGFYMLALARLPLHVAHPVLTCGSVALVAVLAALWLKEPFNLTSLVGVALVLAGVLVLALGKH